MAVIFEPTINLQSIFGVFFVKRMSDNFQKREGGQPLLGKKSDLVGLGFPNYVFCTFSVYFGGIFGIWEKKIAI